MVYCTQGGVLDHAQIGTRIEPRLVPGLEPGLCTRTGAWSMYPYWSLVNLGSLSEVNLGSLSEVNLGSLNSGISET